MDFKAIKIKLASPDKILSWSHGEVTKPETINYRTQKPEREGLFSEVIFGPEKDYQCYCGKYKKARFKGIVCDRCGVEVTRSSVRRERMGHIQLATPVSHIWFLRKVPSKMGIFFDIPLQHLENVIYFASYIVLKVNDTLKETILKKIRTSPRENLVSRKLEINKFVSRKLEINKFVSRKLEINKFVSRKLEIKGKGEVYDKIAALAKGNVISEADWREISHLYPKLIEVGTGAEAVRRYAEEFDLEKLRSQLKGSIKKTSGQEFRRILSRLRLVEGFIRSGTRPEWMFVTVIPVIPPELRPMVALDGGRFASSDVNDLYRRVINRNNRLRRLTELNAPEVIIRNEKRMLQEAVDALIDNSARRGRAVMAATGPQRQLKSLADMLRGKQGRFRKNLLGKRVDYSGRSVIVSGPELGLGECGLPKWMALEILRPFVIGQLVKRGLAHNIKGANTLITQDEPVVWEILDEISQEFFVLLNRAPTLHRLGIQAFKPRLIEGLAIELHPLVCAAFNADFDGDQMAVHLPLSREAQKEAGELMLSSFNLLKPATGKPIVNPSQDIVLGIYWLTDAKSGLKGEGGAFSSPEEALLAYRLDKVHIQAKIKLLREGELVETSVGRILVNQALPEDLPFINERLDKGSLRDIVANMIERHDSLAVVKFLDGIKNLGFHYATASGITWSAFELIVPAEKGELLEKIEREVIALKENYEKGLLSEEERRTLTIQAWTRADEEIGKLVKPAIERSPSIYTIINSGSRGSWGQTKQMAGMKGLVINPYNEIIELPVRSSYKEGLNILEYFNSTHGARKGVTDTALKTSVAGYLTRRLVDVAHDVIVQEDDCKTKEGVDFYRADARETLMDFQDRIVGRVIAGTNQLIHKELAAKITCDPAKEVVTLRSPITCKTLDGICRMCFGYDLSRNKLIELGVAIGVIAAQSIGEPGTQLTMRTFHMGGVVGEADITRGLPRIEEVFEAREPQGKALISGVSGKVKSISSTPTSQTVLIEVSDTGPKEKVVSYNIPLGKFLLVKQGDLIVKGDPLCEGPLDLKEIYQFAGPKATWRYILNEVQKNYNSHGAEINDKYIEVIIRKMFYFLRVTNPGDTNLIPGKTVELSAFIRENERVKTKKGAIAQGERLLLGVTKASLSTESFLSAASFQETASALIDAAVEGKVDYLRGLKENVIIGRLIPAGTGYKKELKEVRVAAQKEKVRVAV